MREEGLIPETDVMNVTIKNAPSQRTTDPCIMVIFGGAGDLTKRKLVPALCNLAEQGFLPHQFAIVGVSTTDLTTETLRERFTEDIKTFALRPVDQTISKRVVEHTYFVRGDFADPSTYERLKANLAEVAKQDNIPCNHFYYLAVAPRFFGEIVRQLGAAGMAKEENGQWRRVVIEKPFGRDLQSARTLNAEIKQVLEERQIYRIDHYLGKETVQNLMMFRFGNEIFEPIWNRRYIDNVQITAAETVGVEQRGGYYETSGALRDMVPNHLFQLLSLTAMEPPFSFDSNAVRDEQAKVLHAIQQFSPEDVLSKTVRGQYGAGILDGKQVLAYRAESDVKPDSNTETFVAMKLLIDNWRWADVPFYLRTGKHLARRVTEISIQFRRAPFHLFRNTPVGALRPNRLVITIQPEESISLQFGAKVPGPIMQQGAVDMCFNYADYFGSAPSTGYERLLYDCMIGDATLFQRADMVEAGWSVITPVLDVWQALRPRDFPNYAVGTWGPREADELLARNDRVWRSQTPAARAEQVVG
jgi:glucose-6-phosphate 1-dehydrogenase